MQIVINISDSIYKDLQLGIGVGVVLKLEDIVVLPKRHGRLIDADVLVDGMEDDYEFCEAVNATPTIIEADGGDTDAGSN